MLVVRRSSIQVSFIVFESTTQKNEFYGCGDKWAIFLSFWQTRTLKDDLKEKAKKLESLEAKVSNMILTIPNLHWFFY